MPRRRHAPRPGRPPLGPDKSQAFRVWLAPSIKARIVKRAAAEERSASDWAAEQLERALDATEPTT